MVVRRAAPAAALGIPFAALGHGGLGSYSSQNIAGATGMIVAGRNLVLLALFTVLVLGLRAPRYR